MQTKGFQVLVVSVGVGRERVSIPKMEAARRNQVVRTGTLQVQN